MRILLGSLSRRIYAIFLMVAVVPTAIAGVFGVYASLQALRNETINNLEQEVGIRAEGVARFLAQLASELRYLSVSPTLGGFREALDRDEDALSQWRLAIENEYANLARFYPHIYQIRFLSGDGYEQIRVDRIGDEVSVVAESQLQYKGDRYYFADALAMPSGSVYVSPLDLNVEFGRIEEPERPVIRMAVPLEAIGERGAGLLIVNLHADILLDQIQQMAGVREGYALLFDRAGYFLSRKERDVTEDAGFAMQPVIRLDALFGDGVVGRLLHGEGVIQEGGWIVAGRTVSFEDQGDALGRWLIAIAFPERALLAQVFNLYGLYAVLLSALMVTTVGGYVVSRRFLGPLDQLSKETEAITRGDFKRRVEIPGDDEVAALGQRFNDMASRLDAMYSSLASRRDELEREVRIRTAELERERFFLARLFERMSDGVVQVAEDGRILLCNPQARSLLAFSERTDSDQSIVTWPPWQQLMGDLGDEREIRADIGRENSTVSVSVSQHEDGYILIARDVTLERRIEADRRELDRQMFQMEKIITLGELAMGLAHEVGNPLAGMKAVAQAMQYEEDLPVQVGEALHRLEREIDRLADFLKGFHGFTAPSALAIQPCALSTVLDDVFFWTRKEARSQGVELDVEIAPRLPLLRADQAALKQVLLNLVINALHATHAGGQVRVSATDTGERVIIRVEDDGCGIAPDVLPKIFDSFFTTRPEGSGLGLVVVRKIVSQHGGDVEVSSTLGVGTCFALSWPCIPREPDHD